jgi:hypothetical protein
MSETLIQFIDPAVISYPVSKSKNELFDTNTLSNCPTASLSLNYNLNLSVDPSGNAAFNTADNCRQDPKSFLPEDLSFNYAREDIQLDLLIVDLERINNPPRQVHSTSASIGNNGIMPTTGLSEPTSPIQRDTQAFPLGPPQDPPRCLPSRPCRKKRGRKRKAPLSPAAEELKRQKFLERNRLAATRCREKKRGYISSVEERIAELGRKNASLKTEYMLLQREFDYLTKLLLECGDYHCKQNSRSRLRESG